MDDNKKPVALDDLLKDNPFDEIDVGIDTKYLDAGVSYNKKTNTSRLSVKLDLNNWGLTQEEIDSRTRLDIAQQQIALKSKMLDAAIAQAKASQTNAVVHQPQIVPPVVDMSNTGYNNTTTNTVINPRPTSASNSTEVDSDEYMSAKAYGDDG